MLTYVKKILTDFLLGVVWPSMNWYTVTAEAGQVAFTVRGSWDTTNDTPLAWIDGVPVAVTWASATTVTLASTAPQDAQVTVLVMVGANAGYYPRAGGVALLGDLDAGLYSIINLKASTQAHHAVRRDEVQALASAAGDANYLRRDGGNKPTQDIDFDGRGIVGAKAATTDAGYVTKAQMEAADTAISSAITSLSDDVDDLIDQFDASNIGIPFASVVLFRSEAWGPGCAIHAVGDVTVSAPNGTRAVSIECIGGGGGGAGTEYDSRSGGGGGGGG
jgi:hypothetical protein